jgi:hypothetical protein
VGIGIDLGHNIVIGVNPAFYFVIKMRCFLDIIPFWGDVEKADLLVP